MATVKVKAWVPSKKSRRDDLIEIYVGSGTTDETQVSEVYIANGPSVPRGVCGPDLEYLSLYFEDHGL